MIILVKLFLAHLLGDFMFQPLSWIKEKETKRILSFRLFLHLLVHGLLICTVLWEVKYWKLALAVMLTHGLIDLIKLYSQKNNNRPLWFAIDQGLHGLSLAVLWHLFFKPQIELNPAFIELIWVYTVALVFVSAVSSTTLQVLMSHWTNALDADVEKSLKNAGKYIGVLERLFVFTFVIIGYWEGIGFLLASKSIFRFGDLKKSKDRKLTEYVLIGTLLSFAMAVAAGLLVVALTKE